MTHATQPPTLAEAFATFLRAEKASASSAQFAATSQALRLFTNLLRKNHKIAVHRLPIDKFKIDWGREFLLHLQETCSIETEHLYSRAMLHFYRYAQQSHQSSLDVESLTEFVTHHRRTKSHTLPHIPIETLHIIRANALASIPPPDIEHESRLYLQHLRDKAFILTLFDTGLRLSEICALRIKQANLANNNLQLTTDTRLPLDTSTSSALSMYLQSRRGNQNLASLTKQSPLFMRHDKRAGSRILFMSRWTGANIVAYWAEQTTSAVEHFPQAASAITANTFRHYFVYRTLTKTQSISEAQVLARHEDIGTTRRYLKSLTVTTETPDE